jgi:import inner membrane translocase subunit TIM10
MHGQLLNCLLMPALSTPAIPSAFQQNDLSQGESVCIDRCVAKFFDVNAKVGEKMQQMGGGAQQPPQ